MTDDERLSDPLRAARALPRGSMIVVRSRQASHRAKLAGSLCPIAHARGLWLLIANDPALAGRLRTAGVHFSEANAREAHVWRARRPHWLITTAAHSLAGCAQAKRFGANAVCLSPAFQTASHPGQGPLGGARARLIAANATLPVYALGGLNERNIRQFAHSRFTGVAAIGGLAA